MRSPEGAWDFLAPGGVGIVGGVLGVLANISLTTHLPSPDPGAV